MNRAERTWGLSLAMMLNGIVSVGASVEAVNKTMTVSAAIEDGA